MRAYLLCGLAIFLTTNVQAATTKPIALQSADGVSYGELKDVSFRPPRLVLIGAALGNTPGALVAHRQAWSAENDKAKELFKALNLGFPGDRSADHCRFYARGSASDIVGFDTEDGRVIRVVLFWKDVGNDKLEASISDVRRIGDKNKPPITADSRFPSMHGSVGYGMLTIQFIPPDYYLLNHPDVSPEIATAMRSGALAVGMTEHEADVSLWKLFRISERDDADGSKSIAWGRTHATTGGGIDGNLPTGYYDKADWIGDIHGGKVVSARRTQEN